ncbi:DUF6279 family lipoprotein [Marinobacter sp. 1Y8]
MPHLQGNHRSAFRRRRALIVGLIVLFVSGCSSTTLAYRQLDWAIVWWVDDFIPLTDPQQDRLSQQVDQLLAWHCQSELPRYTQWLDQLHRQTAANPITRETVLKQQDALFDTIDRLLIEITPATTELLAGLTDSQVNALAESMAEKRQEREDELLSEDPQEQLEKREERVRERAERWLGPLMPTQRAIIAQWNAERGRQTEIWFDGRARWQAALLDALKDRKAPDFPGQIRQLITNSSAYRGEEYRLMLEQSRPALAQLITDLLNAKIPTQKAHLNAEIDSLQEDFETLRCDERNPASA